MVDTSGSGFERIFQPVIKRLFGNSCKMKEIDFLPEWYKQNKKNRLTYRIGYMALAAMFVLMLLWTAFAGLGVMREKNTLAVLLQKKEIVEKASNEYAVLKGQLGELQKSEKVIESLDARIDVTNVLAELSYLIDSKIVVTRLEFDAESVKTEGAEDNGSSSGLRTAKTVSSDNASDASGDVKFKIAIKGVAFAQGNVADFICKLESSPYFCNVIPSYTRNVTAQQGTLFSQKGMQISEFELSCYLANYVGKNNVAVTNAAEQRL